MFGFNPHLAQAINQRHHEQNLGFDGIKEAAEQMSFDPISDKQALVATVQLRQMAVGIVLNMAAVVSETDADDEDAALPSEVLDSLMSEAFIDEDDDGIDDMVNATLTAHIYDVLDYFGVDETVIVDMFNDDVDVADSAVQTATDTIIDNLPDDGEPLEQFVNAFIYGDEPDDEQGLDGLTPKKKLRVGTQTTKEIGGQTVKYLAVKAVRNGKIVTVNKRVGKKVKLHLSNAQRNALKEMRKKAHTSSAIRKQMRSLNKGISKGIYKNMDKAKKMQGLSLKRHGKALGRETGM